MKSLRPLSFLLLAISCLPVRLPAQAPDSVPASAPAAQHGPKVGELAPDFTVVGPEGKPVKLSDFRGKTVLLDLWATWCGPCVASMPHNSELAEKHAKDGLIVLAVCADDSRANYDSWVQRNGAQYKFLTAHDTAGRDNWAKSVFNGQYGVSGFPTLFLIDKAGRLIGSTTGGGQGVNPHVIRLLAKGGLPVDLAGLPPEEPAGPKILAASPKRLATRIPTSSLGTLKFNDPVQDFAA